MFNHMFSFAFMLQLKCSSTPLQLDSLVSAPPCTLRHAGAGHEFPHLVFTSVLHPLWFVSPDGDSRVSSE